jgi:hypothetical protein
MTVMCDVALDDWTPAGTTGLVSKASSVTTRSFTFFILPSGTPRLSLSTDGSAFVPGTSSAAPVVSDGAFLAVGVTYRASDGRGQFWTAATGTSTAPGGAGWTQLGTDQSIALGGSIFSSDSPAEIGSSNSGTGVLLSGVVKRARIWASIDGTDLRLDLNFAGIAVTGTRDPSLVTDGAKGAVATVNGSAWDWATA